MNSGGFAYEETLPAYAEGLPAYGEALPVDAAEDGPESLDRGKDWPLAFGIFAPVVAAYAAVAYGLYLAVHAIL
ncbi:MAG TPA: hypothetical protein VMK83_04100 [Gaiellaceae bacterium]|nr:hypothetical protein [Gaiellaceae bacterium]